MSKERDDRVALCFCHPDTKEDVINLAKEKGAVIPPDTNFALIPAMEEGVVIIVAAEEFEKWLNAPWHDKWSVNDPEEDNDGENK